MRPIALIACLVLACGGARAGAGPIGGQDGTRFEDYAPLATASELARRTQTPVTYDRLQRYRASGAVRVAEHPVDLSRERFDVYLPAAPGPDGRYALLVWISPHARMPAPIAWRDALDRHGMILVAAHRSGNDQGTLERRLPLALHAAHNLLRAYPVDPARVYAGGFSGGARTALRLAVGFPEVFRGALLAAGSDVIGGEAMSPPPRDQLALLQARGRLVWVTGARDLPNRRMEAESRAAFAAHCVAGLASVPMARREHAPPDRRHFGRALARLDAAAGGGAAGADRARAPTLAACRDALDRHVDRELRAVEATLQSGDLDAAGEALAEVDWRRGGLAAPRSVQLARLLAARRSPDPGEDTHDG